MPLHVETDVVRIHKVVASPMSNNSYIVVDKGTGIGIIIDAPQDAEKVLAEAEGVQVEAILITHRHKDHIEGLPVLKEALGAPVGIHEDDAEALLTSPDFTLVDGQIFSFGGRKLRAIHTPGHTPGAMCLFLEDYLFSGDTLFPGGPGHTRTNEALQQSIESITRGLYTLPGGVSVFPGHGDDTTIERSRGEYADFMRREHPQDLHGDVVWTRD